MSNKIIFLFSFRFQFCWQNMLTTDLCLVLIKNIENCRIDISIENEINKMCELETFPNYKLNLFGLILQFESHLSFSIDQKFF